MDDCQNETTNGQYCPDCGLRREFDGRQLHADFCVREKGKPSFAQLPGFPDYEDFLKQTIGDGKPGSLSSLGEQAQTLAARMPALLKAAEEAAQHAQPSPGLRQNIEKIQAINARNNSDNWADLRAQILIAKHTTDPDGALTPLPTKPTPARTVAAPSHDFIGALYKPYFSPI